MHASSLSNGQGCGGAVAWQRFVSSEGRPYYHNPSSKETLWDLPAGVEFAEQPQVHRPQCYPGQWRAVRTLDSKLYYYNIVTRDVAWALPAGASLAGVDDTGPVLPSAAKPGNCEPSTADTASALFGSAILPSRGESELPAQRSRQAARGSVSVGKIFRSSRPVGGELPYLLTLPSDISDPSAVGADLGGSSSSSSSKWTGETNHARAEQAAMEEAQRKCPLLVYLHSTGKTGSTFEKMLRAVAEEAPQIVLAGRGLTGVWDTFIGVAPCCPSNLSSPGLVMQTGDSTKALRRKRVYWFKACEAAAYEAWDFAQASRCSEVEALVMELLAHICKVWPVDVNRIYFVGSSCGGYAALRLAELLPQLPAAVVSLAGYYPATLARTPNAEGHDLLSLVGKLQGLPLVWLLHCEQDRVCKLGNPCVSELFATLGSKEHVQVEWVSSKVAKGSSASYHSSWNYMIQKPDHFFATILRYTHPGPLDVPVYLQQRMCQLLPSRSEQWSKPRE